MRKLGFLTVVTSLVLVVSLAAAPAAKDEERTGLEWIEWVEETAPIPDEAIKALLTKYPEDAEMHLGAAFLFTEDKNKAEAKEKAIKLAPEYKKMFLIQEIKRTHHPYKELDEEALRKLEELVKIDPGNVWPHYLLAAHYLHKGEKERWLREVDEGLSKKRLDDYEVERLRAIFRVLDEINPSFKAVWKIYYNFVPLSEFAVARNSALELVRIGKELEEKGEREKALEYYRKAERIGQHLLLRKPDFFMKRLVSIQIRKIAYEEMVRFYEEEGRAIEAAALREQIDLMDAWKKGYGQIISQKYHIPTRPIWDAGGHLLDVYLGAIHWEEIRPEKSEEIKARLGRFQKVAREFINSPDYTGMVDIYLEKLWNEGETEAFKSLPEEKEWPIAEYLERIEKEREELSRAIDQSLIPSGEHRRICRSNMKQIGLACLIYALDHKDVLPPNLAVLGEKGYIKKEGFPKLIKCFASKEEYVYIGAGKSTRKVKNPSRTIIAYDRKPVHDNGRNVLFGDGHCEWMPEEEFQKRLAEQKEK